MDEPKEKNSLEPKQETVYWNNKNSINIITDILKQNNICLGDTDTVLGLFANVSEPGLTYLNKIKNRENKPYIILINSLKKLNLFVDQEAINKLTKLLNFCWPGPVTIIFKLKKSLLNNLDLKFLFKYQDTIAIRVPDNKYLLELLANFSGLFSTSANLMGQEVPDNINNINKNILDNIKLIILNNKTNNKAGLASTILDCSNILENNKIKVLRTGSFSITDLEEAYGDKFLK